MTTGSVAARIGSLRTAFPEVPVITLVIRTDDAAALEKVIHGVLAFRGRRSEDSPGSEWFLTDAAEIESIYEFARARKPR
jgi:hypothetical protein